MPDKSAEAIELYRFIQNECDRMDVRITTWARRHNIADATIIRWRQGVEPDMRSLRRVAEALGRPLWEVLTAAGYIDPEEVGRDVSPREYDVAEAIRLDRRLTPRARELLNQVYDIALSTGEIHVLDGNSDHRRATDHHSRPR